MIELDGLREGGVGFVVLRRGPGGYVVLRDKVSDMPALDTLRFQESAVRFLEFRPAHPTWRQTLYEFSEGLYKVFECPSKSAWLEAYTRLVTYGCECPKRMN